MSLYEVWSNITEHSINIEPRIQYKIQYDYQAASLPINLNNQPYLLGLTDEEGDIRDLGLLTTATSNYIVYWV